MCNDLYQLQELSGEPWLWLLPVFVFTVSIETGKSKNTMQSYCMHMSVSKKSKIDLLWMPDTKIFDSAYEQGRSCLVPENNYPYPTTEGISLRTPPHPWIFHICKELMTPPPPLRNFHKVRQRPPNPCGKVYFLKVKIEWRCLFAVKQWFHLMLLSGLELEHSKLPTKQPKLQNIAYPFKWKR